MTKPKLKSFIRQTEPARITLTRDAGIAFALDDPDGSVAALLDLLDGSRTVAEVTVELARRWPELTEADVAEGIAGLDQAGLLEDAAAPSALSSDQEERYFNNLAFFGTFADLATSRHTYQERLRRSRVTLLGAGGIGSTLLLQLAGLGVGHITVADFDIVERKNVARQLLYTETDVGLPKLERAVARAGAINGEVAFHAVHCQVTGPADIAELVSGADLLLLTADTPDRLSDWASEACVAAGVPFVTGGIGLARGAYYSVDPGRSGCVACLRLLEREQSGRDRPLPHPDGIHRGISPAGVMLAGLIGLEALRYLTGFAPPISAGRYWQMDLATGQTNVALEWPRRLDCPVCGPATRAAATQQQP